MITIIIMKCVTFILGCAQVIVGGVNLLEQAEEQERLLEQSAKELENRKKKEAKLRRQLQKKEAEQHDIEEKYANLREESEGKTKRLKEVWKQLQHAKEEASVYTFIVMCKLCMIIVYSSIIRVPVCLQIADMQAEFQQENEQLLETIRELEREVNLQQLIMNSYIPEEYQKQLESYSVWNEDTGEWHMVCYLVLT